MTNTETIAEIREWLHSFPPVCTVEDGKNLLRIVDEQSAEIERLNTENNGRALMLEAARSEIERLTKELKSAQYKARKYRDKWIAAHVSDVANAENYNAEMCDKYAGECRAAHALPWEKTK